MAVIAWPHRPPDPERTPPPRPNEQTGRLMDWRPKWPGGLSARLLLLTAIFVLAAQLFILLPSLASYEEGWLTDRVRAAELASLAVEASPAGVVSDRLSRELLKGAGVVSVAVQVDGVRRLLLAPERMEVAPDFVDLRREDVIPFLVQPFITLGPHAPVMLRVDARPQFRNGDFVEIVVPVAPLRADLSAYLVRLLLVSVLISVLAGVVVYLLLAALLVRPIRRITVAMERFRARPEDPRARLPVSGRRDEIGRAEVELDRMQEDLLAALQSRARLAALGEAVAKINHDLRNMLTSAQMASERLASSPDPQVAQAMPRLERALSRAVRLAQNVLTYGRTEEAAPAPEPLTLKAAAEGAAVDAGLWDGGVRLAVEAVEGEHVFADSDQFHRILVNLFRNARQAIEASRSPNGPGLIRLAVEHGDAVTHLIVADNGPGLPEKAQARLFQPFAGSGQPDGAGLGLAISRELARAHGGDLELVATGPDGTRFALMLPDAPAFG